MGQDPATEKTFIIPKELRHIMAALKGHAPIPDDQIVPVSEDKVFPITAARRKAEAAQAAQAALMASIGVLSADGIFVGQYSPTDRDGNRLSMTFNVFAAPRDLPKLMKYNNAVKYISRLRNWHGFDGTHYANDTKIYAALKDGSYTGGWIIPTLDILYGKDVDGKATTLDNLYAHKDKFNVAGDPERAFKTAAGSGSGYPRYYWSSTEHRGDPSSVVSIRLSNGRGGWDRKDLRLSCRPVRLMPVVRQAQL